MRGRYYLKHTINHTVDNRQRIRNHNENYKSILKQNAIDYLRNSNDCIEEKVMYLKNLTHDVYRYGRKYKYECNLNNLDISTIILAVNDDELHTAYFGKNFQQYSSDNALSGCLVWGLIIFLVIIFQSCSG